MFNRKSPRFFFTYKFLVITTLCLSVMTTQLIAEPADQPLDDACLSDELAEAKQQQSRTGKEAYERVCVTCHMPDGAGSPGVFPPLKDSEWTQDSMVLANIILRGVSGAIYVSGTRYASSMPSFSKELTDQEVVDLIQYIQHDFNGQQTTITTADVATIRAKNLRRISSQSGLETLQQQYAQSTSE